MLSSKNPNYFLEKSNSAKINHGGQKKFDSKQRNFKAVGEIEEISEQVDSQAGNTTIDNPFLDSERGKKGLDASHQVKIVKNGYPRGNQYQLKGPEYFKRMEIEMTSQKLNNSRNSHLNYSAGQAYKSSNFVFLFI